MTAMRIAAALATLAVLGACGNEEGSVALEQPPGCAEGLEPARSTFGSEDVRVGDAVLINLGDQQRAAWRTLWDRRRKMAIVKVPVVVPAGRVLTLSVPPEARGIIGLYYDLADEPPARVVDGAVTASLRACRGRYPSVGFPGQLLVARPVCRVPLDYTFGDAVRGRLHLSFGHACRR